MHSSVKLKEDLYWIGGSDRRLALFENVYPVPNGVSYNSYVILDEKTVLLDTVDEAVSRQFKEGLEAVLNGRKLDYLVVNHMEPDHCACIGEVAKQFPELKLIGNARTFTMMKQFFDLDLEGRTIEVKEGDSLQTGRHTLRFYMAPMVHWPEAMVTYDETDRVLFSADAFGTFGALSGSLYADELPFGELWVEEARRYFTNIVGKYGPQVQMLLKKASGLAIDLLCPLHGPIWREKIDWFVEKYQKWSTYEPEERAVLIACGSIYGNTANAVEVLAGKLAERGVKNIRMYDVSHTHPSILVGEAFRCSHLVIASPTYNGGIFTPVETFLSELKAHNLQNRTVALVENGTWAPMAAKLMQEMLAGMKQMHILEETLTIHSALKPEQEAALNALADALAASVNAGLEEEKA